MCFLRRAICPAATFHTRGGLAGYRSHFGSRYVIGPCASQAFLVSLRDSSPTISRVQQIEASERAQNPPGSVSANLQVAAPCCLARPEKASADLSWESPGASALCRWPPESLPRPPGSLREPSGGFVLQTGGPPESLQEPGRSHRDLRS